jgi:hypothetical protein
VTAVMRQYLGNSFLTAQMIANIKIQEFKVNLNIQDSKGYVCFVIGFLVLP